MKKITQVLALSLFVFSGALWAQQDAWLGAWKANLAKSTFTPGPPPRSNTTKREAWGANGMKYTADGVNAQGVSGHNEFTANYDGKDYPVKGNPNSDMVSLKRIDAHSYEWTYKKGGKVTSTGRAVASPDGKTLTVTNKGTDSQGRATGSVLVFEKQ